MSTLSIAPPRVKQPKAAKPVLNALQQLSHATAQELFEWMARNASSKNVSLTSIYRALNYLVESAQVKPVHFHDGQVRYELNAHPMHHHHLICTSCQQVISIDDCPFQAVLDRLNQTFQVQYHNFEVFGLCQPCQAQPTPAVI